MAWRSNGYDGKKVDVWAAGVLLFVMLTGMFPFETDDDNSNTAGLYDLWLAQIKTTWCVCWGGEGQDGPAREGNGGGRRAALHAGVLRWRS